MPGSTELLPSVLLLCLDDAVPDGSGEAVLPALPLLAQESEAEELGVPGSSEVLPTALLLCAGEAV